MQGRIITVSAPWSGNVSSWQVREGEQVKQGDMLALIDNIELRHQLESLQDDLMLNQAQIEAEMSRVQFLAQSQADRNRQAQAEYLQAKAELSSENAKLAEADARYARVKNLSKSGSISGQELEKLTLEISGLRKKIQMLSDAVEVLRLRTTVASESEQSHAPQLKPLLAKIEQLKSEMERLRDRIKLGSLTAPVGGRVVRRHSLTGETLVQASPVVDILEDNSTEIILYVPQKFADEFAIDKEVEVLVQPNDVRVRCVVVRIGSRFEPAPKPLLDRYQTNQYLLAVHIVPLPEFSHAVTFRMDATVTLPYQWREYWSDRIGETKSWWRNWTASASPVTDVNENSNNED